jgi:hypothetical protein
VLRYDGIGIVAVLRAVIGMGAEMGGRSGGVVVGASGEERMGRRAEVGGVLGLDFFLMDKVRWGRVLEGPGAALDGRGVKLREVEVPFFEPSLAAESERLGDGFFTFDARRRISSTRSSSRA